MFVRFRAQKAVPCGEKPLLYIYNSTTVLTLYFYVNKINLRLLIVCFCLYGNYFRNVFSYVFMICLRLFTAHDYTHIFRYNMHIQGHSCFSTKASNTSEKETPSSAYWHSKNLDAAHVNETKQLTLHHVHHGDRQGKRCLNISWIGCWNWINLPDVFDLTSFFVCSFERMLNVSEAPSNAPHPAMSHCSRASVSCPQLIFCMTGYDRWAKIKIICRKKMPLGQICLQE